MRSRTQHFAIETVRLTRQFPRSLESRIFTGQLIRSATSVGANYRAVCRSRSRREFIAKLSVVIEECDETLFWLDVVTALHLVSQETTAPLVREGGELLAIVLTSRHTAEMRLRATSGLLHRNNQQSAVSNQQLK
jgi:four helix bundle protein